MAQQGRAVRRSDDLRGETGPEKARHAIRIVLETGFHHLDCAELYGNEDVVGQALQEAIAAGVVNREGLFITTKL